ncbi:MAG: aminoacetone oxidase family FAD-binding enzyme [Lentisphaerae bacterium]|nr:aminoacetone oxidase family FAD-binding enzyme [Lentisphaerota bacterium]
MLDWGTQVVVIGSGPAGLMAAAVAAGQGAAVTLLEALPAPGRKLLASGAGKCNFTNMLSAEAMADRFAPEQRRFVRPALLNFTPEMTRKFFRKHGVGHKLVDDFYCFPASEKASDILNVFLKIFNDYNVQVICGEEVSAIEIQSGLITAVRTVNNNIYPCDYLIAAGGGPGFPRLGARGSLDKHIQKCEIAVVSRTPALCGLKCRDNWLEDLSGIVLEDVAVELDKKNSSAGTLLFTGEGISGPAALDMAGRAAKLLAGKCKDVQLKINFLPDISQQDWLDFWNQQRQINGKRLIYNLLSSKMPTALAKALTTLSGAGECIAAQLNKSMTGALITNLTACPITVYATESWDKSMASTGGVARTEINANTMQSKRISNLYFAGEFIDVDGPCGGYNIQWALSSGYLAGSLKSKKLCFQS